MSRPRIALFGGSFDPPHLGHLAMAEAVVEQAAIDRVIFLPCAQSPHKANKAPTPGADRLAMLKLATTEMPWAEVSDLDLQLPPPSFTWRLVEHLERTIPDDAELFWILGADQWQKLPTWAQPEKLQNSLQFLVFPRTGDTITPRSGWNATTLACDHPASSSAIRQMLRSGNFDEASKWLSPEVAAYIHDHQLYQAESPD